MDFVVTVKTAVNAVIFTIIGNVDRCEHVDAVAKMLFCLNLSCLCNFFQKRKCGRREQRLKILRCAFRMCQRTFYIFRGIFCIVIVFHGINDLIHDIGADILHIRQIGHVVNAVFLLIFQNFFT